MKLAPIQEQINKANRSMNRVRFTLYAPIRSALRAAAKLLVAVAAGVFLLAGGAQALVVANSSPSSNYQAPAGTADPGWANVVLADVNGTAIYLGNQWVLTARHNGLAPDFTELDAGLFAKVPNSEVTISNPSGLGLSAQADLMLYRIDTQNQFSGTPEQLDSNIRSIELVSSSASLPTGSITIIGSGPTKPNDANGEIHWSVNGSNVWTEVASGGNRHGFENDGPKRKAWGTNTIVANSRLPDDTDIVDGHGVATSFGRDQLIVPFEFNRSVGGNEAQARPGDSGAPVFVQESGDWKLLGVTHSIYPYVNQPADTSVFGQLTAISDFSYEHYNDEINGWLNHDRYSVLGDINLDGVVTGDGTGTWESDDVTALIEGWGWDQNDADVISWKKGDLNQDGRTNLLDFVELRSALPAATAASLNLEQLLSGGGGGTAVPEPSSMVILGLSGASLLLWRRLQS